MRQMSDEEGCTWAYESDPGSVPTSVCNTSSRDPMLSSGLRVHQAPTQFIRMLAATNTRKIFRIIVCT